MEKQDRYAVQVIARARRALGGGERQELQAGLDVFERVQRREEAVELENDPDLRAGFVFAHGDHFTRALAPKRRAAPVQTKDIQDIAEVESRGANAELCLARGRRSPVQGAKLKAVERAAPGRLCSNRQLDRRLAQRIGCFGQACDQALRLAERDLLLIAPVPQLGQQLRVPLRPTWRRVEVDAGAA